MARHDTTADPAPTIQGFDPRTGAPAGSPVPATADVGAVVEAAAAAGRTWARVDPRDRAQVLRAIASALEADGEELRRLADLETALGQPPPDRRADPHDRTSCAISPRSSRRAALSRRSSRPPIRSTARPDVRRMLQPIGPVAVFSASNFPFAFSVAGGDTASALAAGCAVVVKAHEAHPATSQRTRRHRPRGAGRGRPAGRPVGVGARPLRPASTWSSTLRSPRSASPVRCVGGAR